MDETSSILRQLLFYIIGNFLLKNKNVKIG